MTLGKYKYRVWDPLNDGEDGAHTIAASSASRAAELYAEADVDGQRDGCYERDGFALHVRDASGEVFEVRVAIDRITSFEARDVRATKLR